MGSKGIFFVRIFLVFMMLGKANGQSGTNVKNLLTYLFTTNSYNKNVRPSLNQSTALELDVDFFLVGINEIDEVEQKMTTTAFLHIEWVDSYLNWNSSSYGGLTYIYVPQKDIWKPDITLRNGFTKLKELGSDFVRVKVDNEGSVVWSPFEVFETKCEIDITYFPYDKQSCNIIFVVWSSTIEDVRVTLWHNTVFTDTLEDNAEWTLVTTSALEDSQSTESRVVFTLVLQRSSTYYLMNIIVPVIFLALLNVFTFVLPADSGEKMGYCITVFLAFAVFLTIVSAELPKVSGSILGYYLMVQLAMGTFVVCCTALELRLHHRKDSVPPMLLRLVNCTCRSSQKICTEGNDNTVHEIKKSKDKSWNDVISSLDFLLFWTTFGVVTFASIVLLGLLASH